MKFEFLISPAGITASMHELLQPRNHNFLSVTKVLSLLVLIPVIISLVGCSNSTDVPQFSTSDQVSSTVQASEDFVINDAVSLQESTITWDTYQYELTENNQIVAGSYDGVTKTQRVFNTWVLENKYLRVTLIPEWGGRIISIFYKPTGHEQLYQNPVGVPYQIGTGVFYYDWLMVYGGIFPTFPEPEHGKTWLLPWDFQVVSESDQEIIVAMSIKDEIDNPSAPSQYDLGPTGLELTFYVSLKAGRAALDTAIEIRNPGEESVEFEYWTNTTLAPGSDPLNPETTAGAEIVAPVEMIKIPRYWQEIAAQENSTEFVDVYDFENLKHFENWPDMGIAYAFPDMQGANFWGVINHDNEEGIFRIADNTVTPGLKIWTWGYPHSSSLDPQSTADESRPYIELWAGVTREFWQRASFPANDHAQFTEIYSPSVGLSNVTHANENFLVHLTNTGHSSVECQLFGMFPDQTVEISMQLDGQEFSRAEEMLDSKNGIDCSKQIPDSPTGSVLKLVIESQNGDLLFEGEIALSNNL